MKHFLLIAVISLVLPAVHAADDCIIDPELMNKGVWAEPHFRAPGEPEREVASDEQLEYEREPSQYLDVLAKIPSSEPTVSRIWVERKILSEDGE